MHMRAVVWYTKEDHAPLLLHDTEIGEAIELHSGRGTRLIMHLETIEQALEI